MRFTSFWKMATKAPANMPTRATMISIKLMSVPVNRSVPPNTVKTRRSKA